MSDLRSASRAPGVVRMMTDLMPTHPLFIDARSDLSNLASGGDWAYATPGTSKAVKLSAIALRLRRTSLVVMLDASGAKELPQ
jgi:hypothetical protein